MLIEIAKLFCRICRLRLVISNSSASRIQYFYYRIWERIELSRGGKKSPSSPLAQLPEAKIDRWNLIATVNRVTTHDSTITATYISNHSRSFRRPWTSPTAAAVLRKGSLAIANLFLERSFDSGLESCFKKGFLESLGVPTYKATRTPFLQGTKCFPSASLHSEGWSVGPLDSVAGAR